MARVKDYDKKIADLKQKIEAKQDQLKALKKQLNDIESAAAQSKMEDIAAFIVTKDLNPADVLNVLQERFK